MDDLIGLAQRCHAADGGLPHAAEPQFLRGRWSGPAVITEEVRDGAGQLLAAGAVRPSGGGVAYTGLIDPAARGAGVGAALIREALSRMRADGATEAWLDVNVNNPADRLYRRLGFENRGRRARYTR
jgi:ribosomal protein S18 acetylase RimI-like enzyme